MNPHDRARRLGAEASAAYRAAFRIAPREDDGLFSSAWELAAWDAAWRSLRQGGATAADHDRCHLAWSAAFWGFDPEEGPGPRAADRA